jgi:endonuclease/exonuclease/phosphatase family metal-dependent hydrolase
MTRVLSYNILVGGTHRVEQLTLIIRSSRSDVVGLIEAIDEQVVKELAEHLGMQYCMSGRARDEEGWQGAVLSRLPIIHFKIHANAIITKQPLLEVCVEGEDEQLLTVFVTHLTADFGKAWVANKQRRREVQELLSILKSYRGTKHLLMGDFNSLAPGERLEGSSFLRYVAEPEFYTQLKPDPSIRVPDLDFVVPSSLHILKPLLKLVPRSNLLSTMLDAVDVLYAPRGGIDLLCHAGYVDCFRFLHPDIQGYTYPAPIPAGRVDFIFANPELAQQLIASGVIVEGEGIAAYQASDHLPIFAEFGTAIHEEHQAQISQQTILL